MDADSLCSPAAPAFAPFIGDREARDQGRKSVQHLWVVPCLVLAFISWPLGLLNYPNVHAAATREQRRKPA